MDNVDPFGNKVLLGDFVFRREHFERQMLVAMRIMRGQHQIGLGRFGQKAEQHRAARLEEYMPAYHYAQEREAQQLGVESMGALQIRHIEASFFDLGDVHGLSRA